MSAALILLGHGSRAAAAGEQFLQLVAQVRARREEPVYPAFMELANPRLADAVAEATKNGATEIVVQPCFLFDGNHMRRDVPEMLAGFAAGHPEVRFRFGRPLGPDPRVAEILLEHAEEAAWLD